MLPPRRKLCTRSVEDSDFRKKKKIEHFLQAFNEELDGMYNDANLPDDEAWQALCTDLQKTKESRNNLSRENS